MDNTKVKEILEASEHVENLKSIYYSGCAADLELIIRKKATSEDIIDAMYVRLVPFLADQRFASLFNELEDYVRGFDEKLTLSYRLRHDQMEKDKQEV